jgi:hypothetical protein
MNFSGFVSPYLDRIKDYQRGIPKGGGRPDGFNAAKFGAYMPDDGNEVAMDPRRLLGGVVKGATDFLNPDVAPPDSLQRINDAVFGRGGGGAPSRPGQLSPGEEAWRRYARGNDLKTFAQGGSGALDREEQKRRLLRGY